VVVNSENYELWLDPGCRDSGALSARSCPHAKPGLSPESQFSHMRQHLNRRNLAHYLSNGQNPPDRTSQCRTARANAPQKPNPDLLPSDGLSGSWLSVDENRASHELAACQDFRKADH
jgi:hypothetical protein